MLGVAHRYTKTQDKGTVPAMKMYDQKSNAVMGRHLRSICILSSYQSSWTSRNPSLFRTHLSESKGSSCSVGEGDP